jgi:hypothetical protein
MNINNVICPLTAIEKKYVSKRNSKFAVTSASDPLFDTDDYELLTRQYCLDKLEYVLRLYHILKMQNLNLKFLRKC